MPLVVGSGPPCFSNGSSTGKRSTSFDRPDLESELYVPPVEGSFGARMGFCCCLILIPSCSSYMEVVESGEWSTLQSSSCAQSTALPCFCRQHALAG